MDLTKFQWTREPAGFSIDGDTIAIITKPHTDLWQRTYYHFQNDNAPVFQMETEERFFSFTVKTDFSESCRRFDQCGVVMYLDSENWLKASVEYENEAYQHLGSVVTNGGYSDWATTVPPEPSGRRLPGGVFPGRAPLRSDADLPYPPRRRKDPLWALCLLPGGLLLPGRFFPAGAYRMPVAHPRWPAAR